MATKSSPQSCSLFSSPLTINQLDGVISLLVRSGFPQKKWKMLGLKLGLHRNTLFTIEEDYSKLEDRFSQCIARWLRRVDDLDADSEEGATFDSLSEALRSLFEFTVADKLDQEKKPLKKVPARSRGGTQVSITVKKLEYPTSSPDTIHFRKQQEPGGGNVKALKGHFESGTLAKMKVESKDATSAKPLEYMTLKKTSADIIDLLAGNPAVINPLANHLFASSTIPQAVQREVTNALFTPAERAEKLMNSLLAIIERHPNPSSVISSIISSLQNVDLTFTADKLEKEINLKMNSLPTIIEPQSTTMSVIQLSTKDEVGQMLVDLDHQFTSIIAKVKSRLHMFIESQKLTLQSIASCIEQILNIEVKRSSLNGIFTSITPYYDFLNCTLIKKLVQKLIPKDGKLHDELRQYIKRVEKLSSSSQLKYLRSPITRSPLLSRTNEQIVIKFHKRWEMITMSRFDDALEHYFEECHTDCYKNFDSAISITLSIAKSQAVNFAKVVEDKKEALARIGILDVAIGKRKIPIRREKDDNFNVSLCQSVKAGDSFEVSMLLQLGADPNSKDERGKSAVEIAIEGGQSGHVHILKSLLVNGANGFTHFISAVKENDKRVIRMLLDADIDVNAAQGKDEETALIAATKSNCEQMVQFLLQQKAIVIDKADNLGYSALHYACMKGFGNIVPILLKSNADIHLHTKHGSTPLKLATQHEHQDIVEMLRSSRLVTESEEMEALAVARTPGMQRLLVTQASDQKYVPSPKIKRNTVEVKGNDIEIIAPSLEKCQEKVAKWKDTERDKTQNIIIRESSCESISFVVSHVLEKEIAKGLKIAATNTPLTRESVQSFSSQLSHSESLRWLTVSHNSIGDEGLEALAESLCTNKHVTVLSLYGNPSITSAKSLAKLIETNTSLTYLSAWGLNIGEDGVRLLLEALKKNAYLITLVLDDEDEETCQSYPLYQDVKDRVFFNKLTKIL